MTRNEEYAALLAELSRTPPALAGTADRALERQAASRRKRRWLTPLVLLLNFSGVRA